MSDVNLAYVAGGRAKIVGPVTGRIYWFPEGGSIPVDEEDATELLKKKKKGQCCGDKKPWETQVFVLE